MNNSIFFGLYNIAHQSSFLDKLIVFCAEYLPYLVIIFIVFYIIYKNSDQLFDWKKPFNEIKLKFNKLVYIFTPVAVGWISVSILKDIFKQPRPFILFADKVQPLFIHGGMDSFPSGHATFFAALALSTYFVNKKLGTICFIVAIIVGVSRIISGVHFPVDILVGYMFGLVVSFIFKSIFKNKISI